MKKIIVSIILVVLTVFIASYAYKHKHLIYRILENNNNNNNNIETNTLEPVLAVFSFKPGFENLILDNFHHFNIKLYNTKHWKIKKETLQQIPDNIPVLLTIETWASSGILSNVSNPLEDLQKGMYDHIIELMCKEWIGIRPNVYLRFNPEMEVPVHRYPWQYYAPTNYINAYRHFAELCRKSAPQAKLVWGPAGYPGTMELYPGDDVVDAASVTIKSESEMSLDVYPKNYPVIYDVKRRIHRIRFIDKPIFVLGSNNASNDSINLQLVSEISDHIVNNNDIIYAKENFKRSKQFKTSSLNNNFEIGFYDPNSLLVTETLLTVEHLFADFGNLYDGSFYKSFQNVINRRHKVIVTFEPFRNPYGDTDLKVLQHITEGKYNKEIEQLFSIITSTKQQVYLRYAHEMEIPITRYPWQSHDPVEYIKSFRYFMTFKNPWPENIKRVWGPAGDRGSVEWYPGNDVVDFISIAIYGLPDKNITDPEKQESFASIFYRKSWRMRFINKPFFITEFGVKGPEDYQTLWLETAAKTLNKNPQVIGVNYFNMSDTPGAWGKIKPPDWSITPATLHRFMEVLERDNL